MFWKGWKMLRLIKPRSQRDKNWKYLRLGQVPLGWVSILIHHPPPKKKYTGKGDSLAPSLWALSDIPDSTRGDGCSGLWQQSRISFSSCCSSEGFTNSSADLICDLLLLQGHPWLPSLPSAADLGPVTDSLSWEPGGG